MKVEIQMLPISKVKLNPKNPRFIKNEKFHALVESLEEFPDMINYRPLILDKNHVILGGNMRFRAVKELGWKNVPVIIAKDLDEARAIEFMIKDNSSFGEWDWDKLANEYDFETLEAWGVDLPKFHEDRDMTEEKEDDEEWEGMPKFEEGAKPYKLMIIAETEDEIFEFINKHKIKINSRASDHTWYSYYPEKEKDDIRSLKYEVDNEAEA